MERMQRPREIRQPGDRAVAPGRLALVQAFVNSVNVEFGPDEFASAEGLIGWLERNGFESAGIAPPDELDLREAVTLREALRGLLRENNGGAVDARARRALEHVARGCPVTVGFGAEGGELGLRPVSGDLRGVLGSVLVAVAEARIEGSWRRLKSCSEHRCEWAFYDRSRNRGSRWCSMAVCGTRAKMHRYRGSRVSS
ncbi:CGNR zinc finger domain-containing protein [Embleya sp. NBC_00896]|uniref:CGNR zinc finger domain-containing protein n=1 Tax=Embleya sp. NBC_00896 TaxID=2975961 RepID=UPI00386DD754|nr:CGNR zinc finger domain-containing protein [Embleya sp. NBC_00896]